MYSKSTVINLAVSVCTVSVLAGVFSVLIFDLVGYTPCFLLACVFSAFLYPLCLGFTRSSAGYWKGQITLIFILTVAEAFAEVLYFYKMEPIHHDFRESAAIGVWYFGASIMIAICLYPLGYWVPRGLRHVIEA